MTPPTAPLKELRPEENPAESAMAPVEARAAGLGKKKRALVIGGAVLAAVLIAAGVHALLTAGQESTDDAQVEADVVQIAPRVGGQVVRMRVTEDQVVKKGDVIAEIDDADYAAKAKQAEAELETARAQAAASDAQVQVVEAGARGGFASAKATVSWSAAGVQSAGAQIGVAQAGVLKAQAEARKAELDLNRAKELRAGDAISQAQLDTAQVAYDTAQAGLAQAKAQLVAAEEAKQTAIGRVGEAQGRLHQSTPIEAQIAAARANADLAHARVKSAEAVLDLARLQVAYTRITAPADGQVSKLTAREGQMLAPAQPIAELVPHETYVVANFKETQIGAMHPGQRAEVEIDTFPGKKLEGTVESLSGGTGARFSLLPPDNASGNFVKVVERVPVRIRWSKPPDGLVLRAGLSATATVHTRR